jgi:predicted nucleotidyltransferase
MDSALPVKLRSEVRDFLSILVEWACDREDLIALALVGSQARGDAKPESDVDILLLVDEPSKYLQDIEWLSLFGIIVSKAYEDWGKVTSIRVQYASGLEVELGLTDNRWGDDPEDSGDRGVVEDGIVVLYEKERDLSSRLSRFT